MDLLDAISTIRVGGTDIGKISIRPTSVEFDYFTFLSKFSLKDTFPVKGDFSW